MNFFRDCMLFKSKEKLFIRLGLATWLCIAGGILDISFVSFKVYKHYESKNKINH